MTIDPITFENMLPCRMNQFFHPNDPVKKGINQTGNRTGVFFHDLSEILEDSEYTILSNRFNIYLAIYYEVFYK